VMPILRFDCRERALDQTTDRLGAADPLLFSKLRNSLNRFSRKSRGNRRISPSRWPATWPLHWPFHLTPYLWCA
jgi:hypothetical protein